MPAPYDEVNLLLVIKIAYITSANFLLLILTKKRRLTVGLAIVWIDVVSSAVVLTFIISLFFIFNISLDFVVNKQLFLVPVRITDLAFLIKASQALIAMQ